MSCPCLVPAPPPPPPMMLCWKPLAAWLLVAPDPWAVMLLSVQKVSPDTLGDVTSNFLGLNNQIHKFCSLTENAGGRQWLSLRGHRFALNQSPDGSTCVNIPCFLDPLLSPVQQPSWHHNWTSGPPDHRRTEHTVSGHLRRMRLIRVNILSQPFFKAMIKNTDSPALALIFFPRQKIPLVRGNFSHLLYCLGWVWITWRICFAWRSQSEAKRKGSCLYREEMPCQLSYGIYTSKTNNLFHQDQISSLWMEMQTVQWTQPRPNRV